MIVSEELSLVKLFSADKIRLLLRVKVLVFPRTQGKWARIRCIRCMQMNVKGIERCVDLQGSVSIKESLWASLIVTQLLLKVGT